MMYAHFTQQFIDLQDVQNEQQQQQQQPKKKKKKCSTSMINFTISLNNRAGQRKR